MDDLVEILDRLHNSAIEGERVNSYTKKEEKDDSAKRMLQAVRDVSLLLADGEWLKKSTVRKITEHYHVRFDAVCEVCRVAESDDGKWLCVPKEGTPEEPELSGPCNLRKP